MRWGLVLTGAIGINVLAFAACDEPQGPPSNRYYIAPDADPASDSTDPIGAGGDASAPRDAAVDAASVADLAFTGWWRANYAAGAWLGTPSAGPSGTYNLAEGVNPPAVGAAVNTFLPAEFDGVNDQLASPTPIGTLLGPSAWTCVALVYVDATAAPPDVINLELVSDTAAFWNVGTQTSPAPQALVAQYDNAAKTTAAKYVSTPLTVAAWNLVQTKLEGGSLRIRVNGGAWVTTPSGVVATMTGTLYVGRNSAGTLRFRGKMLELMLSNTAFPDAAFDRIRAYASARYGLSL
jgi:hypothetical protein